MRGGSREGSREEGRGRERGAGSEWGGSGVACNRWGSIAHAHTQPPLSAICLDLLEKVDVLEYYDATVSSVNEQFFLPAVLRTRW